MQNGRTIEPPDSHHVLAATGWLELGNPAEAAEELRRVGEANRDAEEVLTLLWFIEERQKAWDRALEAARRMREAHPRSPFGFIHFAYALRRSESGGLRAAWEALEPAVALFPKEPIIPYNLACYAAQLREDDRAWDWLRKAMEVGDPSLLRKMALADPDLESLWPRLRQETPEAGS